jgi:hypothetical protein
MDWDGDQINCHDNEFVLIRGVNWGNMELIGHFEEIYKNES